MNTIVGRLAKNKIVRDMQGNIIDWFDETRGGWIVQKRVVVNTEVWNEHLQREKDKQEAAKAVTEAKIRDDYPESTPGNNTSDKVSELEKRVDGMDSKLDAILNKLK